MPPLNSVIYTLPARLLERLRQCPESPLRGQLISCNDQELALQFDDRQGVMIYRCSAGLQGMYAATGSRIEVDILGNVWLLSDDATDMCETPQPKGSAEHVRQDFKPAPA